MIQIRSNTFETNSSSMHSLVIRSDNLLKELEEDTYFTHEEMFDSLCHVKNGVYRSYLDEWYFGRFPFRPLDTFELKFQYAYANYQHDSGKLNNLVELLKDLVPEVNVVIAPDLCGVDEPMLDSWLKKYNITLREFLTNKKYIAIQDGDEYYVWADLIRSGLIDTENLDNREDVKNIDRY